MGATISSPWFYDRVIAHEAELVRGIERAATAAEQRDNQARVAFQHDPTGANFIAHEEQRGCRGRILVALTRRREHGSSIRRAAPVLVGPATLESLLTVQPDTYDAFIDGRLPFNPLFFEFAEPYTISLPLQDHDVHLHGLHLTSFDEMTKRPWTTVPDAIRKRTYFITLYYEYGVRNPNRADNIGELGLGFNPSMRGRLVGESDAMCFYLNLEQSLLHYTLTAEIKTEIARGEERPLQHTASLHDVPNGGRLQQLANLSVNLVNYINAHNVTMTQHHRTVQLTRRTDRGKKRHTVASQPYYLVTIRDALTTEAAESGQTRELAWRIFVRGHYRRLRDDNGSIYLVTWVRPHLKGPTDAPWREQRYQVLADKLLREQELSESYTPTKHI